MVILSKALHIDFVLGYVLEFHAVLSEILKLKLQKSSMVTP